MITKLQMQDIGPVNPLEAEFGSRLNLITGDNGLGKSFLLDTCWYALTGTWADAKQFYPSDSVQDTGSPRLRYWAWGRTLGSMPQDAVHTRQNFYDFRTQTWTEAQGDGPTKHKRQLVIYARVDGGFSLFDSIRRDEMCQFSKTEVWRGKEIDTISGTKRSVCNGLIHDIGWWRLRENQAFVLLQKVLENLSASGGEALSLGDVVRIKADDVSEVPTLKMPYGLVPVTEAAAGMKRVLALAYMLVWAWEEHRVASKLRRQEPTNHITLLFDEVQAHLHPKWQRVFLPALLKVIDELLLQGEAKSVQLIATTHAPLVLSSVEPIWNGETDKLFDFDLNEERKVTFKEVPFAKQGSAVNWLTSESFDLPSGYSVQAEKAMAQADAFMREYPDSKTAPSGKAAEIHQALKASLGGDDEYWPFWLPYYDQITSVP